MILRTMNQEDYPVLDILYRKHYQDEFQHPEFHDNYLSTFIVENDDRSILIGGGIRALAEVVLITDKSKNVHSLGEALIKSLGHSINVARMRHIDFLHAHVKDPSYQLHLVKHGFEVVDAVPLSLWVKKDGR